MRRLFRIRKEELSTPCTATSPPKAPFSRTTARSKACGRAEGAARALIFPNPLPRQDGGGIVECVPLRQPGTRTKKLAFPLLFPADARPHSYGRVSDHISLDIANTSFTKNYAHDVRQRVPALRLWCSDVPGAARRPEARSALTTSPSLPQTRFSKETPARCAHQVVTLRRSEPLTKRCTVR